MTYCLFPTFNTSRDLNRSCIRILLGDEDFADQCTTCTHTTTLRRTQRSAFVILDLMWWGLQSGLYNFNSFFNELTSSVFSFSGKNAARAPFKTQFFKTSMGTFRSSQT